jgi:hypothetical protein
VNKFYIVEEDAKAGFINNATGVTLNTKADNKK